jgi:outer membrane immunogenic protein
MRLFAKIAILLCAVGLPATAHATDLLTVPTSGNDSLPVADAGFDWNGFYAGVYGVTQASPVGGLQYGLGLDVGANARFEFVLVGGEVDFHGLVGGAGSTTYLQALGKVGVMATDDIAVYAAAGAGLDLGPPAESDVLLGAGAEFALADNVSIDARYLHGFPTSGGNPKDQFTVGANFHF